MWDLLWHSSSLAGPNSLAFSNPHFQILFPITSLTCLTWQAHLFLWSEELLQDLCQEEHDDGFFLLILRSTTYGSDSTGSTMSSYCALFPVIFNSILHARLLHLGCQRYVGYLFYVLFLSLKPFFPTPGIAYIPIIYIYLLFYITGIFNIISCPIGQCLHYSVLYPVFPLADAKSQIPDSCYLVITAVFIFIKTTLFSLQLLTNTFMSFPKFPPQFKIDVYIYLSQKLMKNKNKISIRSVFWSERKGRLSHHFWMLNSWDWSYCWLGDMFLRDNSKKKEGWGYDCTWLIYKYESETEMQMAKEYKGRRNWMNITVHKNGDERKGNKGDNGKWGALSVAFKMQAVINRCVKKQLNWLQHNAQWIS